MKAAKRSCELCEAPASVYCDADQASLCWDCDDGVHGVNFLVARHCRTLLCQTCNSLTEWRASGSELGRLVSVCEKCYFGAENGAEDENFDEIDVRDNADLGDIEDEDDDSEEEEVVSGDEDRDNQVVPSIVTELAISLKRKRGDASDLSFQYGFCQNISSKYGCGSRQQVIVDSKKNWARLRESAHLLTHVGLRRRTQILPQTAPSYLDPSRPPGRLVRHGTAELGRSRQK